MAFFWIRGPFGRDFVNRLSAQAIKFATKQFAEDADRFKGSYEDFLKKSSTKTRLSAEEMRSFILSNDWEVVQKSYGYTLRQMLEGIPVISSILHEKPWEVLISEGDNYFCTSDFPVVTVLPDRGGSAFVGMGFGIRGVEVFFPLTRRACLLLRDRARRDSRAVPARTVREINKLLMVAARRYIYACEKNSAVEKLFSKIGCKSVPGENAFMRAPCPPPEEQAGE
jgi:hypothetical protein